MTYTNKDRANDAETGLKAFEDKTHCGSESWVRDFLANLMHYCRERQIDFDHELSMATDFYSDELEDEGL